MKAYVGIGVVLVALGAFAIFLFTRSASPELVNYPPKNEVIVAFGDSLVEGIGSTPGNDFVSLLSEQLGAKVINEGVAGDTTAQGLVRIDAVQKHDPGIVLLLLGGNDALRRIELETTERNLATIIQELQYDGALVVLLGVRGGLIGDPYDDMYEALSERYGTVYIPNVLSGILLKPELTADQIHPNDKGYRIVADRVYEALVPILK